MKILIFSDTHLSEKFEEHKFNYLSRIIKDADRVIIDGDFWEAHATTFSGFITSHWKHLFPMLKSRKTVYIYGNHDKEKDCTKETNLFSDIQTARYEFSSGSTHFIVEHGNNRVSIFGDRPEYEKTSSLSLLMSPFTYLTQKVLIQTKLYRLAFQRYNKIIKKTYSSKLKENEIFVCGHTHCAEIDLKNHFVNSGINSLGLGQCVIIEDGIITAHEEWYG